MIKHIMARYHKDGKVFPFCRADSMNFCEDRSEMNCPDCARIAKLMQRNAK